METQKQTGETLKMKVHGIDPQKIVNNYKTSKEKQIKFILENPEKYENKDPNLTLLINKEFNAVIYHREFTKKPNLPKVSYVYVLIGHKLYSGRMKKPFISYPTLDIAEEHPGEKIVDVVKIVNNHKGFSAVVKNDVGKEVLIPLKEVKFEGIVKK